MRLHYIYFLNLAFTHVSVTNAKGDPFPVCKSSKRDKSLPCKLGCYEDKEDDRALVILGQNRDASLEECAEVCEGYGTKYFSRQFKGQCWCGDGEYDKHGDSKKCKNCGGDNVGTYLGCVYEMPCTSPFNDASFKDSVAKYRRGLRDSDLNDKTIIGYGPIGDWEICGVSNIDKIFRDSRFNEDISKWDVSSVTSAMGAFDGASNFDHDIFQWDVSAMVNMKQTFAYTGKFNSDISSWDVSSVKGMEKTFEFSNRFNQDISDWEISKVTSFEKMFDGAHNFNQKLCWKIKNKNTADMFTDSLGEVIC